MAGKRLGLTLLLSGALFAATANSASACGEECAKGDAQAAQVAAAAAADAQRQVSELLVPLKRAKDKMGRKAIPKVNEYVVDLEAIGIQAKEAAKRAEEALETASHRYWRVQAALEKEPNNAVIQQAHNEANAARGAAARAHEKAKEDARSAFGAWQQLCMEVLEKLDTQKGLRDAYNAWRAMGRANIRASEVHDRVLKVRNVVWRAETEEAKIATAQTDQELGSILSVLRYSCSGELEMNKVQEETENSRERIAESRVMLDRITARAPGLRVVSYLRERLEGVEGRLAEAHAQAREYLAQLAATRERAFERIEDLRDPVRAQRKAAEKAEREAAVEAERKAAEENQRLVAEQAERDRLAEIAAQEQRAREEQEAAERRQREEKEAAERREREEKEAAETARLRAEEEAAQQRIDAEQLRLSEVERMQADRIDVGPDQIQADDRTPLLGSQADQGRGCCRDCTVL
jgi:hypothetical protein